MKAGLRFVIAAGSILAFGLPAEAQTRGGTLNFAIATQPPTFDCHAANTFGVIHPVRPHYSTLLQFDLRNYPAITGDLAESWTVSPDQLTYTFRLHPDVSFHDGSKLTAADVKASYERLRNPPAGVVSVRKADFEDIAAIETPDPRTVVFRLRAANAAMPAVFASPWNCIYSAPKLAEDPTFPARTILGSGPFRFVEQVPGSHWVGARFDGYFRPGLPHLDGYRGVFFAQSAPLIAALQVGQVVAEFRGVTPAEGERLRGALGNRLRTFAGPSLNNIMISFNTEKAPFSDVRVRRALSLAIDRWGGSPVIARQTILRHVGGIVRPGAPYARSEAELEALPGYGRDMEAARAEARRLLAEAGVPNLSFTFTNRTLPLNVVVGVYLLDQWRRIGVTAEHRTLENGPWQAALTSGNFEVISDFTGDYVDEPNFALAKYISFDRAPANSSRAIDRTLDAMFDRQKRGADQAERFAIVKEFERRAIEQVYLLPLYWVHREVVMYDSVKGWHPSPSNVLGQDLTTLWLER